MKGGFVKSAATKKKMKSKARKLALMALTRGGAASLTTFYTRLGWKILENGTEVGDETMRWRVVVEVPTGYDDA